jgi:hypothetical protein
MRTLIAGLLLALASAAQKPVPPVASEDEVLMLEASALVDKAAVAKALGQDPGMDMIVVQVKLSPRGDAKVKVDFDDFTLISRKDGQRSQPLAPSQIAGSGALVVTPGQQGGGGGGFGSPRRGPIWGGMPGTGSRPQRVGGEQENGGAAPPTGAEAVVTEGGDGNENPLMTVLRAKALPQKETTEPVAGLLYFFLEGKHKLKQLELLYKSPVGRQMILDFEK